MFFGSGTDVALRSTSDKGRLQSALASAQLSAGATHYGPVLKLAGSILAESTLPRREVVLVTDFQRGGWRGADGVRLPDGAVLTPEAIGDADTANVAVTPVAIERSTFSDQERVTVTAGVTNHGAKALDGVDVTLEVNGRADSDPARQGRRECVVFDDVRAGDADGCRGSRDRQARRRRDDPRQRVPFHGRRGPSGADHAGGPSRDTRIRALRRTRAGGRGDARDSI